MSRYSDESKRPKGAELFFVTPVILGGSPSALDNIAYLDRRQHIAAVRFWNKKISELRKARSL
jgi:hypothetical protein